MNPRIDLYATIHKALRALMAELVTSLGRMDPADGADVNATLARFLDGLDLCEHHGQVEDELVHPAIEARRPGATAAAAAEHASQALAFAQLRTAATALLAAAPGARRAQAHALYRQAAAWMAGNLEHMEHEERHHNAALWDAYADAELLALHGRILAAVPPATMGKVLRWIVPASNHGERLAQFGGMRASAPREAYEGALAIARERLTARDWEKLARALEELPVAA